MADPTAALLWAACRPNPGVAEVGLAIEAGADLEVAARLAIARRVSPLLWRALRDAAVATGSHAWAAALRDDATRCHMQSRMVLPQAAALALTPLVDAGLEPLAIKGVALAERYPDPGLRPMDDIDIVLPPERVETAMAVLLDHGWALHDPERHQHEVHFVHSSLPGLHVDLHRSMGTWRNRSNRLTTSDLWHARTPAMLFGVHAWVLTDEWDLVAHAAHAGKPFHAFDRLIWIVDIAVMAQRHLDWDTVGELATKSRCRTALAVALTLAGYLGVESPADLRRVPPKRADALAPLLSADFPTLALDRPSRARVGYALVDERRTRLRLVVARIFGSGPRHAPRRSVWFLKSNARRIRELLS